MSRGMLTRLVLLVSLSTVTALWPTVSSGEATALAEPGAHSPGVTADRAAPVARLNVVRWRHVRAPIPVAGRTSGQTAGKHRLVLQRYTSTGHGWTTRATRNVSNGGFQFAPQYAMRPGWVKLRVVLYAGGRRADVSNVITVRILANPGEPAACTRAPSLSTCPRPATAVQHRTLRTPYCPQLRVLLRAQQRTVGWRWDSATRRWVPSPTRWVTTSSAQGPANAPDCVHVVARVPSGAVLPDLRIKQLTRCGRGDSQATGGTCFLIVPSAPFDSDFPALEGKKLLKFGVITLNVGAGPGEIVADRSASSVTAWRAYQSFYSQGGRLLGSVVSPNVRFYFAGDGHNHWHVRDFDRYELLSSTGKTVARAEKHGYCMQDNTTYTPMEGKPRVPAQPVYLESTSCGKGLPNALTIIHGLSRGWGDTYPTSLPDQAIDITGVPNGVYTVRVHADAVGAVKESNESNNVAQVKIRITGNTVTVVPGTATGGLS